MVIIVVDFANAFKRDVDIFVFVSQYDIAILYGIIQSRRGGAVIGDNNFVICRVNVFNHGGKFLISRIGKIKRIRTLAAV